MVFLFYNSYMNNNTIFSLVTKPITQNIAIIRVSGDQAFEVVNNLVNKQLSDKQIQLRTIVDKNKPIDQVMILKFTNPNSFTGEDVIEIQSHGSLIIVNQIISLLLKHNITQAQPGEFSKRALMNGKIDLIQAESINSLIFATNEFGKEKSLEDLQGVKKEVVKQLEKEIIKLKVHLQTNIDYPEDVDIKQLTQEDLKPRNDQLIKLTNDIIKNSKKIQPALKGYDIAIIGKPNVGKSSLLNLLINKDKAIVTNISGTTRDLIEEKITFKGIEFNIIDTAGIRETKDLVESIGIDKTKQRIEDVILVLDVYDASCKRSQEDDQVLLLANKAKNHISVLNKIDQGVKNDIKGINISVKDKNINPLISKVEDYVDQILKDIDINSNHYFINQRQLSIIEAINKVLLHIDKELKALVPIDILLISISDIEDKLKTLSGRIMDDDQLQSIFDKFCLGK